jgi:hypothetical protein
MEPTNELNIQLSISRKAALPLLVIFFLCWHPGFIGSESLTLTTYYPAPYGGYVSLLTTSQTLLARDGGNVGIGLGAAVPTSKLHVQGNANVVGDMQANRVKFPGVGGNSNVAGDYYSIYQEAGGWSHPYPDLRIQYHTGISYDAYQSYGGHRFFTGYDGTGNPSGLQMQITAGVDVTNDLRVGQNLYVAGTIMNVCTRVSYRVGFVDACPSGTRVMGSSGDGCVGRTCVTGFLPAGNTTNPWGTYIVIGDDWAGTMVCCKFGFY